MKFTLSWLNEHLEHNKSTQDIIESLIDLGIEVEEIIDYTSKLKDFSVGYIKSANPHPDADKLKVCMVDTKAGELQIVCGAPNAREGIYVIFAPVGVYIEALDITLKQAKIRGVDSCGMMLSEKELGISDEHGKIIEIQNSQVGLGADVALNLNDILFDVSITPNRGDLLGVRGIAKDLVAKGVGVLKNLSNNITHKDLLSFPSTISLKINSAVCSKFSLVEIHNLDNRIILPNKILNRLKMIGQNSINPLVDLVNYLCIDMNQPMHIYDADKIIDKSMLCVDYATNKQKIICLDEKEYLLDTSIPIVSFNNQIGAIGGIKGGLDSLCDENTKNIFLEVGVFNQDVISFAKRTLGINSESSYRFEREIDSISNEALQEAVFAINTYFNSSVASYSYVDNVVEKNSISIEFDYIDNIIGYSLDKNLVIQSLQKLGFEIINNNDGGLIIKIPSFRNYIKHKSDIVSDILRIIGLDTLKHIPIIKEINQQDGSVYNKNYYTELLAKKTLAQQGFVETINMSFISQNLANLFDMNIDNLNIMNPISIDLSVMRSSIIPSLLNVAHYNISNGNHNFKIFEVGNIYSHTADQELSASMLLSGKQIANHWYEEDKIYSVWDMKSHLFSMLTTLGLNPNNLEVFQDNLKPYYHLGKSGYLSLGKDNIIAQFGVIHPQILKELGIKQEIIVCEIFLNRLPLDFKDAKKPLSLSPFMPLYRDFSFIFKHSIKAHEIIKLISSVDKKLIVGVEIFDIYIGEKIPDNTKSIAIKVAIQPYNKNLIDDEINMLSSNIITIVESKLGGILRDK